MLTRSVDIEPTSGALKTYNERSNTGNIEKGHDDPPTAYNSIAAETNVGANTIQAKRQRYDA